MVSEQAAAQTDMKPLDSAFMMRVFYAFAALALLSVSISLGGKWFGKAIAMAGHTDDRTVHEVVIGNNVIAAPANAIRFERARRNGIAERLDLYLRWPDMQGYTPDTRDDFNHAEGRRNILFLSFETSMMSRDMSGRFDPIYRALIEPTGKPGPAGLSFHAFTEKSGYINEMLAIAPRAGTTPFVARCLTGPNADESLAPCERDVHIGEQLSLSYRFPSELLGEWRKLDAAVMAEAVRLLQTGR